jgi:hypothetical protein
MSAKTKETVRLEETREGKAPWKKWGPYILLPLVVRHKTKRV